MKGLAPADTLTGKVQRALTDEWRTQREIVESVGIYDAKPSTVRALLERLCSEGRAEWQLERNIRYMSGGVVRWRRKGEQ